MGGCSCATVIRAGYLNVSYCHLLYIQAMTEGMRCKPNDGRNVWCCLNGVIRHFEKGKENERGVSVIALFVVQ